MIAVPDDRGVLPFSNNALSNRFRSSNGESRKSTALQYSKSNA